MLDFQKYNIKEKKQKEEKKKATRIIKNNSNNNHIKTMYGVCLKKIVFFLKSNSRL